MLAVVAPGQGSQSPGMLTPWLTSGDRTTAERAVDRIAWFSAVTGLELTDLGTQADEAVIRDTAVAQPLLVATGLLAWEALTGPEHGSVGRPDIVAGHSVGELTAAVLTGSLSVEQSLVLVTRRGAGMAAAAAARSGGMTAVLGGDPGEVLATLERLGLTAANMNGGGQVVAAGDPAALEALTADPPARARLRPLAVAGAFHTEHMAAAATSLAELARGLEPGDARIPLVSNTDGRAVTLGAEILERIVGQVAHPVRWDLVQQALLARGVTGLLELAPAGTLTGLARRNLPGVATFALRTPEDLAAARTFVREHASRTPPPAPGDPDSGAGPAHPELAPTSHATVRGGTA